MSTPVKAPAFQYYPRDFLCDANVMAMDLDAIGAYWVLVSVCWLEHGLSAEPEHLARVLKVSREKFEALWLQIAPCFYLADGRFQHTRLDKERAAQRKYSRAMSLNGRKGGKPRESRGLADAKPIDSRTIAEQSTASASASASASAIEQKRAPAKSVFRGKRSGLTLFQWQWDEMTTRLGPKAATFDFAGFCEQVDAEIAAKGTAAPWPYLLDRLVTVAQLERPNLFGKPAVVSRGGNIPSVEETSRKAAERAAIPFNRRKY